MTAPAIAPLFMVLPCGRVAVEEEDRVPAAAAAEDEVDAATDAGVADEAGTADAVEAELGCAVEVADVGEADVALDDVEVAMELLVEEEEEDAAVDEVTTAPSELEQASNVKTRGSKSVICTGADMYERVAGRRPPCSSASATPIR